MTTRQCKIAKCLTGFIDRAYYPDYSPTDEHFEMFFKIETDGKLAISETDRMTIKPLLEAKGDYELQIKMVFSECAEWWAKGWGWDAPIHTAITGAKEDQSMEVYAAALDKIYDAFKLDPIDAISSYTGFSQEEKNKYFKMKAA